MKFGLAQLNPRIGALAENTQKILETIDQARQRGAQLLIFPELAITGYPPRDLLDFEGFVDENEAALKRIEAHSRGLTVVCGFVEKRSEKTGCPYFNSAAVMRDGKRLGTYRKRLIPNYDIFDEARYFEAGKDPLVIDLEGKKVALSICEDIWNRPRFSRRAYVAQTLEEYKKARVDFLINLSASPFRRGKPAWRQELLSEIACDLGCPILLCNQVGGNDELLFDGCSLAVNAQGETVATGKAFEEELLIVDSALFASEPKQLAAWPATDDEMVCEALKMGLRDYVHKCGSRSVGLGLSGGIDSSVAVALAVEALGPENVWALSLPTQYTSAVSKEDARTLATNLKIDFHEVSIQPLFEVYEKTWLQGLGLPLEGITRENVQPRLRMSILMGVANSRNSLLLNTSNKSELATGFSTLYGDGAGAISVLGDLTKKQVYALGRTLNRKVHLIPERVFSRAPTAELRLGQVDQDALPPYDVLDALVVAMLEQNLPAKQLSERISAQWAPEFMKRHLTSEFKRWQHPPVLRVSPRAFGVGRRIPIAATRQD